MTAALPEPAAWQCRRLVAHAQVRGRVPSLAAGVFRAGALLWYAGVGHPEPDPDMQFRIGSITKTFTAVLVLRLRDEGLLDLADPLDRHVPGTPLGRLTLGGLLAHTAGAGREPAGEWWERSPGRSWADLAAGLDPGDLALAEPGAFHYSNLAYGLLGEVVARRCGKPWEVALQDLLLEPLALRRTTYAVTPPRAAGWSVHPWADTVVAEPLHETGAMAAAGQLWSTAADLARWGAFLADPDPAVLASATLAGMVPEASDYGLGLMRWVRDGRVLVGHAGSMPGFRACLAVDRAQGVGSVVLANATAGLDTQALAGDLVDAALDPDATLPAPWRPGPPPPPEAAVLLGPWFWGYVEVVLSWRDGRLRLDIPGRAAAPARFVPAATDTFRGVDGEHAGETLRVVRRPDGGIAHLNLSTYVLTREPYGPG